MTGASIQFLTFALIAVIATNLSSRPMWRCLVLLAASIIFLAICGGGGSYLPLAGFLVLGYIGIRVPFLRSRSGWIWVAATILVFAWLKQYTFFPRRSLLKFSYFTLGLSYIFFRVLHVMIDVRDGALPPQIGIIDYLTYTLNFTTMVAGPIQRLQDFIKQIGAPAALNIVIAGEALERILVGFFKANVLGVVFSSLHTDALKEIIRRAGGVSWSTDAVVFVSYTFFLYCNFSGYIDIVIGIARLMRIVLPENFSRPFSSDNFIHFWSRWHITLSEWLKTYVYNPLLLSLMRNYPSPGLEPVWGVLAFFVTFFLVGAWHGQTSIFLFFGFLQGAGVALNKLYQIVVAKRLGRKRYRQLGGNDLYIAVSRGLTFTWFTFTLIWFWSKSWEDIQILLSGPGLLFSWAIIFAGSTALLAAWEMARNAVLAVRFRGEPLVYSRYVRTAWVTGLSLISVVITVLLNQSSPDIVYKAF